MMSGEEEIKQLPPDHSERTDALPNHHQNAPVPKHADAQEQNIAA